VSPDFFDDLERHLDRAAQRQARWGRLATAPLPTASGVLAAVLIALVVAAGALAIPRLAGQESELPAGPRPAVEASPDPGAPDGYGCDGPIHPETLAAFSVLRDRKPLERVFQAPDGITFLSGPVLAREAFGRSIWLIPAATPPDCAAPLICIVTDFGNQAVSCHALPERRSTPLDTRVEFGSPEGSPNVMFFAAAPDGLGDQTVSADGFDPVELTAGGNVLVAGGRFPEEKGRQLAEAVGMRQVP
jgi:hypothetical protein